MIRDIAGRQNHSVKLARKLQKKKFRRERGLLVCEGLDLLLAAWAVGADIRDVLVRRELLRELPADLVQGAERERPPESPGIDIGICDTETLEYVSSLGGAADVIFTCAEPACSLGDVALGQGLTLYLDGLGDPGNVGTIVRGMVAFGGKGVVCSPGTADPYGPKAMRAGMGAQFELPVVVEVTAADLRARLAGVAQREACAPQVWVADAHSGDDVRQVHSSGGLIVVLGAERTGPGSQWEGVRRVTIPQCRFESLNVAMAGTIIAYELGSRAAGAGEHSR
jgi:RNA methyltransferase, TrmH family